MRLKKLELFPLVIGASILASLTISILGFVWSVETVSLIPRNETRLDWSPVTTSDSEVGGVSTAEIVENKNHIKLDYFFQYSDRVEHPYSSFSFAFESLGKLDNLVDLTRFDYLLLEIVCQPTNVIYVVFFVYDASISKPNDILSYRMPSAFVECGNQPSTVKVDLQHLRTPDWWIFRNGLEISNRGYTLSNVQNITLAATSQGPIGKHSSVVLKKFQLVGRNFGKFMAAVVGISFCWSILGAWLILKYRKKCIKISQHKANPKSLDTSVEPVDFGSKKDRVRNALIDTIKAEYTAPEFNAEAAGKKIGINRNKVNLILKRDQGLTFTAYLNQLRLNEAARLIRETDASISEIAYSVGYRNVTYFNKIFKDEFERSPTAYKKSFL